MEIKRLGLRSEGKIKETDAKSVGDGKPPFQKSAAYLIIVNLFPLVCVLAFDWSIAPIMFLYWSENIVVGFINVLKMRRAQGSVSSNVRMNGRQVRDSDKRSMIVFFIVHYGGFTLGHGVFVIAMFGLDIGSPLQILLAWSLLFLSHFRSYRRHFIRNGEYRRTSFDRLFFQPYKRIIIMHITILAGGALAKSMNAPPLALAVMVLLKTGIDLVSHVFEHRKFSKRPVSGQGLPPDCYQPEKRL